MRCDSNVSKNRLRPRLLEELGAASIVKKHAYKQLGTELGPP